jgi:hypothetical protein
MKITTQNNPLAAPQAPMQQAAPVKSQREIELENQLQLYAQELQKLTDRNYLLSLKDETTYRLEILTSLNSLSLMQEKTANVFREFLDELKAAQTGG